MVKVVGITGSIAVGKSTVTKYLLTHGYSVLDADEISKHALDRGTKCYQEVKERFDCVDFQGNIDRKMLGNIVFHDADRKKELEAIIHPYVIEQLKQGIRECHLELLFLDIPLLYEVHLESLCDKIIVVYVDEKTQSERLMQRNHITKEAALHLMSQQISIERKKEMADYIIDNRQNFEDLYQDIERVLMVLKNEIIHE